MKIRRCGMYTSLRMVPRAPTCGQTGCADSFERDKTDSDVLSFVAVFQADPLGVSRSRDARLWARPWSGLYIYRPITSLARWNALVNHRSSCSRLLPRFLAAVERFLGPVCARSRHGKSFELRPVSRRNVYTRARLAFIAWFCCRLVQVTAKDRSYCPHVGHLFNSA